MNDLLMTDTYRSHAAALLFAKSPSPFATKPGRLAVRVMDVAVTGFVCCLLTIVALDRFHMDSYINTGNGVVTFDNPKPISNDPADAAQAQTFSDMAASQASAR